MKATIYLNNEVIYTSNKISAKNLAKKENELKQLHGCMKMEDRVKNGFLIFTN